MEHAHGLHVELERALAQLLGERNAAAATHVETATVNVPGRVVLLSLPCGGGLRGVGQGGVGLEVEGLEVSSFKR